MNDQEWKWDHMFVVLGTCLDQCYWEINLKWQLRRSPAESYISSPIKERCRLMSIQLQFISFAGHKLLVNAFNFFIWVILGIGGSGSANSRLYVKMVNMRCSTKWYRHLYRWHHQSGHHCGQILVVELKLNVQSNLFPRVVFKVGLDMFLCIYRL